MGYDVPDSLTFKHTFCKTCCFTDVQIIVCLPGPEQCVIHVNLRYIYINVYLYM